MRHTSAPEPSRGGFVMFFVLLMLFAISVTGVTGYLVVNSEFSMSNHAREGAEVISIAHGGMQRFLAEQTGVVGDSVVYTIGLGIAIVTSRKLMEEDSLNHLYYLRSEGTLNDIRTPGAPVARRVVGAFAWHRLNPLPHRAAVIISSHEIDADDGGGGDVDGDNHSWSGQCPGWAADDITGAIAEGHVEGDVDGTPDYETRDWVLTDMADSLNIRWDVLQDPDFEIELDVTAPPNFGAMPLDSFPLVRYQGNLAPGSSWSGRGVLVVTGMFDPTSSFNWDGIVLAGSTDDIIQGRIAGMLFGGFDGPNPYDEVDVLMDIDYNPCYVYAANRALSYLELVDHTIFDVY